MLGLWRSTILSLVLITFGATGPGCSGPYSGKSERLKRPRPKKPKEGAEDAVVAAAPLQDQCRTNFFDDPGSAPTRRPRDARRLTEQAERLLAEAEQIEGEQRRPIVSDAIARLSSALGKDPYSPLATYRLAVAYALVSSKGCAIALLERLRSLQDYPPVEGDARRVSKRAARDLAFDRFRDDARKALGE